MDMVPSKTSSIEEKEKELYKSFYLLPNSPERAEIYKQWKKVYDTITTSKSGRSKKPAASIRNDRNKHSDVNELAQE